MNNDELRSVKQILNSKIDSLRNDALRAYADLSDQNIQTSPFPITMYVMSVIDYFSSLYCGWSNTNMKLKRFQSKRMINFCHLKLGYGKSESEVFVSIYRH